MNSPSTESLGPREPSASPASWDTRPSSPPGARVRFALASVLFLLWVVFLAVLAVVSGKRPEVRERQPAVGARAAAAVLHVTRQPPQDAKAGSQAG